MINIYIYNNCFITKYLVTGTSQIANVVFYYLKTCRVKNSKTNALHL